MPCSTLEVLDGFPRPCYAEARKNQILAYSALSVGVSVADKNHLGVVRCCSPLTDDEDDMVVAKSFFIEMSFVRDLLGQRASETLDQ